LPAEHVERHPELTVVLPVRNEGEHIERILADLCDQDIAPELVEFLVVDGRSDDDTQERVTRLAAADPRIRLLDNPRRLAGAARNIGAAAAAAPYILFVDGHCRVPSRHMLSAVLEAFRAGAVCVSRPQPLDWPDATPFQQAVSLARSSWLGHDARSRIYDSGYSTCSPLSAGCGYTRELYFAVGGVDESFDACEDLEFNARLAARGITAVHHPDFTVIYAPRSRWRTLLRQLYRYGYGRARLWRRRPSLRMGLAPLLSLFLLLLAVLPVAAVWWPPAGHLWLLMVAVYGAAAAATTVVQAVTAGRPGLWWRILACLPAIHLGAGLGFLSGLLGGPPWSHHADGHHGR